MLSYEKDGINTNKIYFVCGIQDNMKSFLLLYVKEKRIKKKQAKNFEDYFLRYLYWYNPAYDPGLEIPLVCRNAVTYVSVYH